MEYTKQLAVSYFCTKAEYLSGQLKDSMNRFLSIKPSKKYCFDLFFVFDQGNESDYSSILDFESHENINSIFIHSLHIPDKDNVYVRSRHSLKKFKEVGEPALGLSAGPNNLFFGAMNYLSKKEYDYYMVLETDTRPVKYFWFDLLFKYSQSNDFLIGGSTYKGQRELPREALWVDHLNGVAIYKNCDKLHDLLSASKAYMIELIKDGLHDYFVNFDIGINYYIKSLDSLLDKYNDVVDTDVIVNASLRADAIIKEQDILRKHRKAIILHQKI